MWNLLSRRDVGLRVDAGYRDAEGERLDPCISLCSCPPFTGAAGGTNADSFRVHCGFYLLAQERSRRGTLNLATFHKALELRQALKPMRETVVE